jgi:hypothetical protein
MQNVCVFSLRLALIAFPAGPRAQLKEIGEVNVQPTPEIKKLFEALAGDWDTSGKREHTRFFPSGGERKGRSHVRLAGGGAMSVMEGRSDGSAGRSVTLLWSGGIRTQSFLRVIQSTFRLRRIWIGSMVPNLLQLFPIGRQLLTLRD